MTNTRGRLSRIRRDDDEEEADDQPSIIVPEDVLFKVFSFLPMKSLRKFKCLSKQWLHIISSDPHFIHLHSQHSKSKPPLLFSISYPISNSTILLQSSFNMEGKLLNKFKSKNKPCSCSLMFPTRFDLICYRSYDGVCVCNPNTQESITVPPLYLYERGGSFGFGYVQSRDEYKIVHLIRRFSDIDPHCPTECRVFTLGKEDDSPPSSYAFPWGWKQVGNSPYHVKGDEYPAAFVGGALHWLIDDKEQKILAFKVDSEEFNVIPCPNVSLNPNFIDFQLVELRGLLCISCAYDQENKMDIWMLKDYHNKIWIKEFSIDMSEVDAPYCRAYGFYVPRDIEESYDGNIKVLIETRERDGLFLFYYHLQTASFSGFIYEEGSHYSFFSFYTSSLRSLRHVVQTGFVHDQTTQVAHFQPQLQLVDMDPPIYIVCVIALFCNPEKNSYGGCLTELGGRAVVLEGKLLNAEDSIEAEAKAILCGLQLAHGKGIKRIGLVSNAKELVDAIYNGERQHFQRLENIITMITDLLSEFSWAQIFQDLSKFGWAKKFHDPRLQRMLTEVACHVASVALCKGPFFRDILDVSNNL